MPFSLIPFALLIIPLLEIGVFIAVGSQIGVFATLGMVVLTAIIGSILLRVQGFGLLTRMRSEIDQNRVPGRDLVHGVMILVAGILLGATQIVGLFGASGASIDLPDQADLSAAGEGSDG